MLFVWNKDGTTIHATINVDDIAYAVEVDPGECGLGWSTRHAALRKMVGVEQAYARQSKKKQRTFH